MTNTELTEKDYVTLEVAKSLKSIGFDVPTHTHYHIRDKEAYIGLSSNPESWLEYENVIDRPILQKAIEWLREHHNVSLRISWLDVSKRWFYDYLDITDGSYMDSGDYYCEYNDAVNDGICEICDYIKNFKLDKNDE